MNSVDADRQARIRTLRQASTAKPVSEVACITDSAEVGKGEDGKAQRVHAISALKPSMEEVRAAKELQREASYEAIKAEAAPNLFRDQHGSPYLLDEYGQVWPVDSGAGRLKIAHFYQASTGRLPGKDAIDKLTLQLHLLAASRPIRHTFARLGVRDGWPEIDLANGTGGSLYIGPQGPAVGKAGIAFRRGRGTGPLPQPVFPPSPQVAVEIARACLTAWGLPTDKEDQAAILTWMVGAYQPNTPKPLLELCGPAGSGKTTIARNIANTLDPSPGLRPPNCEIEAESVAAVLAHRYVLLFDNEDGASSNAQDLLCKLVSGMEYATRKLYTQDETHLQTMLAPAVVTSVQPFATRTDLQSRTLRISLSGRANLVDEITLSVQFERDRSQMLGAIAVLLSAGLSGLPAVRTQRTFTHRLVDFEQLGEAIHQSAGWAPGDFGACLARLRQRMAQGYLAGDQVGVALRKVVAQLLSPSTANTSRAAWDRPDRPGYSGWHRPSQRSLWITPKHLLSRLSQNPGGTYIPRDVRALVCAVVRLTPTLADIGLRVRYFDSATSGNRRARFEFELK